MFVNDRVIFRLRPQARHLICSIVYFGEISILLKNITINRSKDIIGQISQKINHDSENITIAKKFLF